MKRSLLCWLIPFFFPACPGDRIAPLPAPPKFWVAGTYVILDKTSFCTLWDTLAIAKEDNRLNSYLITRHTTFQRNLERTDFPVETSTDTWSAQYDSIRLVLESDGNAQPLDFLPAYNAFRLWGRLYTKIQ